MLLKMKVPALLLMLSVVYMRGSSQSQKQLILASVVFRHGDRSPVDAYPKDNYTESYWPQGFGQLSTTGMRQEFFLGTLLRERYVGCGLITSNYTRVQVYVRSTDYDRTLMSAEALLAGLFPPQGNQVWNDSIPWQPIPVHTVPKSQDNLLRAYGVDCPKYQQLREEDKQSAEYKKLNDENQELFKKIEENTGQIPTNLSNVWSIQDTLFVQSQNNISLPKWLKPEEFDKLTDLAAYTLALMFSSQEKQILTSGNWIGKVVNDMKTRVNDPENPSRLYLYSAHDTTVAAMTSGLGVYNGLLPPYATALTVELYNDTNGDYWVSLFYRNDTDGTQFRSLGISSCADPSLCTLQEFIDHTKAVIPSDWERRCGLNTSSSSSSNTGIFVAIGILTVVSAILIVVTTVLMVWILRRKMRGIHRKSDEPLVSNEPAVLDFDLEGQ